MEDFKIQHFVRNNVDVSFPDYESLSAQETEYIRQRLCQRLDLPSDTCGTILVSAISDSQKEVVDATAEDENFDLIALLTSIGIDAKKGVFVNWYQFDKID